MIELLTTEEMAEADRPTIAGGIAGAGLMEAAGRAVANAAAALSPGRRIVVVAGPGNNGGDGFVAARLLAERGFSVRLCFLGDRQRLRGDAARAAALWSGPLEPATPSSLAACDVIVDALFGAGLDRPVEGAAHAIIEAINAGPAQVVAVDMPSGINGTTGAIMGVAVRAEETVTFFRRKVGHLAVPGRLYCGRIMCWTASSRTVSSMNRPFGALRFRYPTPWATNTHVARPLSYPAVSRPPALPAWPLAGRCGQARGLSTSPAREKRSVSTPRRVWR